MNSLDVIDYWISSRYHDKEKTIEWINTYGSLIEDLSKVYSKFTYNVDLADSFMLDIIGAVIDMPRIKVPNKLLFFGYLGSHNITAYDIAPYYDANEKVPSHYIFDSLYKRILKYKIRVNNTDGSRLSILNATKELLGINDIEIVDNEDMTYKIILHEHMDNYIIYILDQYKEYISPCGVKFLGYQELP